MSFKTLSAIFAGSLLIASCGKDATSSSSSTESISSAITTIANGVSAAGTGMQAFALRGNLNLKSYNNSYCLADNKSTLLSNIIVNSCLCDPNTGMPTTLNQSDPGYPYAHTYCAMTISSGDTVRGGFDLAKSLMCALEKGGVQFDGIAHNITINFLDTECFPNGGPHFNGITPPTTATISTIGTAPADFNTYFSKGVEFTFSDGSDTLVFQLAANISTNKIEFIGYENWASGNQGVMAGSLDKTTKILKFEKRDERIYNGCNSGGACWNRHTRIRANLELTNGEPTGVTDLSYGYADLQMPVPSNASDSTGGGTVITASGSLADGVKSILFNTTSGKTRAQTADASSYVKTINADCMTKLSGIDPTAACATTNNGIDFPNHGFAANATFMLHPDVTHLTPSYWLGHYSGFNFTDVDLSIDQAF